MNNNNILQQLLNDDNDQIQSVATEIVELQQMVRTNKITKDEYQELVNDMIQSRIVNQLNDVLSNKIVFQRSLNLLKKAATLV